MDTAVTIRALTNVDLEWARKLRNNNRQYFFDSAFVSQKQHQEWFSALAYPFFVIEYNGRRVGTVAVRPGEKGNELHNVLVDTRFRRKGLLRQALAIVESRYGSPIYLDVAAGNEHAVRAYKRLGFTVVAHRLQKK